MVVRMLSTFTLCVLVNAACGIAADETTPSRPTLRILQELMASAADSLFAFIPASSAQTVMTTVLPPTTYWYLEQPAMDVLRRRSLVPSASPGAAYTAEFGVTHSGVVYLNPRRTWFLGSPIVDRSVQLSIRGRLVETETGAVLAAREFACSFTDTVAVSDVDALETPGIQATRASVPSSGLFSAFVEPVVLVGSIAVAIILLFSVRS